MSDAMGLFDGITIVGLTGQSGAGKSTVSKIFKDYGLSVIDADSVSKSVAKKESFLNEVKKSFPDCVTEQGLDRQRLAGIVFNNKQALKSYTDLIFPYITHEIFAGIRMYKLSGKKVVVLDAPTLFESGLDSICQKIVSVIAPMDVKIKRILERDGIPVELVRSRLSSQNSEAFFREKSDYVIVNDSDLCELQIKACDIAGKIVEAERIS